MGWASGFCFYHIGFCVGFHCWKLGLHRYLAKNLANNNCLPVNNVFSFHCISEWVWFKQLCLNVTLFKCQLWTVLYRNHEWYWWYVVVHDVSKLSRYSMVMKQYHVSKRMRCLFWGCSRYCERFHCRNELTSCQVPSSRTGRQQQTLEGSQRETLCQNTWQQEWLLGWNTDDVNL